MSTAQMSTIEHHPGEDMLLDYYHGRLSSGMQLTVATHLELCTHCRSDLRLFDAIGADMLDKVEAVPMSDNALDLALARIERPIERPEPEVAPAARAPLKRPAFLDGFELPSSMKSAVIKGRYWAAPGVWMAPVKVPDAPRGSKTYLMFAKGGMVMPEHTHKGREVTVMLKGSFSDAKGTYVRGDFAMCDDDDCHSPAMGDDDCLCLITQEADIVPLTWLGRVLQPFARI